MNKVLLLSSLFVSLFVVSINSTQAQETNVPVRLKDVKTVYVDDASFRFLFSSCATVVGKMVLPCPNHAYERDRFLVAFKRWLVKSGFTLAETRESAEGIVQGTLSIDERGWREDSVRGSLPDLRKGKKDDDDCDDETRSSNDGPKWNVDAWLVNQNGRRIWKRGFDYPSISYAGGPAKIEGKKLAKALEYDFKHNR